MLEIDLNADIGEGAEFDAELLKIISSASIACGGHAGNEEIMRQTLKMAKKNGVVCGAHPGFMDKENFGRVRLDLPIKQLQAQIKHQLQLIQKIADEENVALRYVKLHGALANMCAEDEKLAIKIYEIVAQHNRDLAILALDNSAQITAANKLGLNYIREAYADRTYDSKGLLVARSEPNAIIIDNKQAIEQCLRLAKNGEIKAIDGTIINSKARSICLHGDNPHALEMAQQISKAMQKNNIKISSPL